MNASKHSTRAVATAASTSKLTFAWSNLKFVMVAVSAGIDWFVSVSIVAPLDKINHCTAIEWENICYLHLQAVE